MSLSENNDFLLANIDDSFAHDKHVIDNLDVKEIVEGFNSGKH
jgi:hypothetical protein